MGGTGTNGAARAAREAEAGPRPQLVKFSFFKVDPAWRRLDPAERARQTAEFQAVVEDWAGRSLVNCYSTIGTRGDVDFVIWQIADSLEELQAMAADLAGTALAGWLSTPYSYLSMTKRSAYDERHAARDRDARLRLSPGPHKYLFVYPLTKRREWYSLPRDVRQAAMNQHMATGVTYRSVKINTTYSFGLDDQEFVLAFETDYPEDFLDLVQELRGSQASAYTAIDVPIFTCLHVTAAAMLELLAPTKTRGVRH